MKRVLMVAAAMLYVGTVLAQEIPTSKLMEAALGKANVMMQMSYDYTQEASKQVPAQKYSFQAICLTKDGLFMTFGISQGMRSQEITNLKLTAPGENGKSYKAEFLWADRETGLAFVRATENGEFTPASFNSAATLKVGTRLFSVGIFEDDPAHGLYVAPGYVSGVFRWPGKVVLVSGGSTVNEGAPILNEEGQFVGISVSQFLRHQVRTQQGPQEMQLESKVMGHFVHPASEFAHVIDYAIKNPTKKRQLSWIGVLNFDPVDEAGLVKVDVPAVIVGKLAKGGPAEQAGLKERDVVVKVDGKGLEKFSSPVLVRTAMALNLIRMPAGQKVTLTVRRGDKEFDVPVTVTPQPQDESDVERYIVTQLGFMVRDRAESDAFVMPEEIAGVDGLLVLQVPKNGPADKAGLQPGDMITQLNNERVSKVQTFKTMLDKAMTDKPNAPVNVTIQREKAKPVTLAIYPPAPENKTPAAP